MRSREIFGQIIGNEGLRTRLGEDVLTSSLAHAYIIEGKAGSGKHTVARQVAAALSCKNRNSENMPLPCGECEMCKKILGGKSPDVINIGRESGKAYITVDTVRQLRTDVMITPNDTDYKVYIIEDADTMNVQAQNAFLLTLEEPPKYAVFFLLCENSGLLLETVRSRAPVLRTEPTDSERISDYICRESDKARELRRTSPQEYRELLVLADSSIGQAMALLDEKTRKPIMQNRQFAADLVSALADGKNGAKLLEIAACAGSKRDEITEQLTFAEKAIRDLVVIKKSESAELIFYTDREATVLLAGRFTMPELFDIYEVLQNAKGLLGGNANVRLTLMNAIVRLKYKH